MLFNTFLLVLFRFLDIRRQKMIFGELMPWTDSEVTFLVLENLLFEYMRG